MYGLKEQDGWLAPDIPANFNNTRWSGLVVWNILTQHEVAPSVPSWNSLRREATWKTVLHARLGWLSPTCFSFSPSLPGPSHVCDTAPPPADALLVVLA